MATLYVLEYQKRSTIELYHQKTHYYTNSSTHANTKLEPVKNPNDSLNHYSSDDKTRLSSGFHHSLASSTLAPTNTQELFTKTPKLGKNSQRYYNAAKSTADSSASSSSVHLNPKVLGRPAHCPSYLTLPTCKVSL